MIPECDQCTRNRILTHIITCLKLHMAVGTGGGEFANILPTKKIKSLKIVRYK